MSLKEFRWIWKDSSKDEILKQYYFDYINWKSVLKEWSDLRDKAIEYIKENTCWDTICHDDLCCDECDVLLNILQGNEDNN